MKKLFSCFLILTISLSFSQSFNCGEDQQELLNKFNVQFLAANSQLNVNDDPSVKHVFNVRYHIVYNDDGVSRTNAYGAPGLNIGFDDLMNSIKYLNVNFNQFNIFFKYYGFDTINNTDFLSLETNDEYNELTQGEHSLSDAINIYVINGGVVGAQARTYVFDDNFFTSEWIMCHEMGHIFGLAHANVNNNHPDCQLREHSERRAGFPNFNADTRGDQVIDTHAYAHYTFFDNDCVYTGGALDCLGVPIVAQTTNEGVMIYPSQNNFMYANAEVGCSPVFTPGQGKRMRGAIIGYFANTYNGWRNTVESLYEPFEVISTVESGAVLSVTDQPGECM